MAKVLWSPNENMQSADYHMVGVLGRLSQPIRVGGIGEGEFRGKLRAFGAVADDAGVGAGAGEPEQGVDQQRFAGAGFTGNHRESGVEAELGGTDDGEILEGEMTEHDGREFA